MCTEPTVLQIEHALEPEALTSEVFFSPEGSSSISPYAIPTPSWPVVAGCTIVHKPHLLYLTKDVFWLDSWFLQLLARRKSCDSRHSIEATLKAEGGACTTCSGGTMRRRPLLYYRQRGFKTYFSIMCRCGAALSILTYGL